MKKTILSCLLVMMISGTLAQPYLDIINIKYMHSPDAGIFNRDKNSCELDYTGISINLPIACKAVHGIALVNPFFEQWHSSAMSGTANILTQHQNYALAVSFIDTVASHKWGYAATPIIRIRDFLGKAIESLQAGLAGLAIFHKSKSLSYQFGVYCNTDYFGFFLVPLVGIDWRINKKNKLFGILPGSMSFEHKANAVFFYGLTFNGISNSYKDAATRYFKVEDNQLGVFLDTYLAGKFVLNTEIGHSFYRKLRVGEKSVFQQDLGVNDNFYIKFSIAYRIRFSG